MTDDEFGAPARLSRRQLMGAAGALGAAGLVQWAPAFTTTAAAATVVPPGFPPSIPLYRQGYRNWAGDIVVDELWTCAPRTPRRSSRSRTGLAAPATSSVPAARPTTGRRWS